MRCSMRRAVVRATAPSRKSGNSRDHGASSQNYPAVNAKGCLLVCLSVALTACDPAESGGETDGTSTGGATSGAPQSSSGETSNGETSAGETSNGETSAGETSAGETGSDPTGGEPLSVNAPCVDEDSAFPLVDAVVAKADSSPYARAVVDGQAEIDAMLSDIAALPFPDSSATAAEADGLAVQEGDVAYTWGTDPQRYLYIENGAGYSVFQYDGEDDLLPREVVYVDQDEACMSFAVTNYAFGTEGDAEEGDILLGFGIDQAGTATFYQFARNLYLPDVAEYRMRTYEDSSGDYARTIGGAADLEIGWTARGEGTFVRYEDSVEVESGLW